MSVARNAGLLLLALLPLALLPSAASGASAADSPSQADKLRTIAIAEDQRRWSDGELRGLLSDPNAEVRARAALATGRLQDSATVEALLPLVSDPDAGVRREAVFALGQIGHRSVRVALEGRLADADEETAVLAIEALGKIGDKTGTPSVVSQLGHASAARRAEAAMALWRLADSTALQPLILRASDPDPVVRWRVLYALEKIVAPDQVVLVAALHASDPEWLTRAYAARTLGRQKSSRGTAYALQGLGDPEVGVAVNAARALQMIADTTCTRCARSLSDQLGHLSPYVRSSAATALADRFAWVAADSANRGAAIEALTARLADPDPATRASCARALLTQRGEEAYAEVAPLLEDSSVYVRATVLEAVAQALPARAAPLLERSLEAQRPLLERMTAAEQLGRLERREATAKLEAGLDDSSVLFAAASASGLAAMGDSTAIPALARAYVNRAADGDPDARTAIRDALRDLAGRAYADSLERRHPPRAPAATSYPLDFAEPPRTRGAVLHTTHGDIEWAFQNREAPQTVRNFVKLAKQGYFDGLFLHRVVPNFVIQDGDPSGTGSGGPGYTIRCEYNRLRYDPGMVGMALSGKDTGGSQWFITHSPQPHLNGRYTIFARVTKGMEIVHRVTQGDRVLKVDILE